jgi:hypothetical protein
MKTDNGMNIDTARSLTNNLREIRSLLESLGPLLEDGKEEYHQFVEEFDGVFSKIAPHYTLAMTGTVSSGKSTLLSSLLKEVERGRNRQTHPISSSNPSNETFAPVIVRYGESPYLIVHYFEEKIINDLRKTMDKLKNTNKEPHRIALYENLVNKLEKVDRVTAGTGARGVVDRIDLANHTTDEIRNILRDKIARSSKKPGVYGVFRAELAYPGEVLQKLNNIYFADLFGFGDPNPIIERKYSRFISEVPIDIVIYVFPNRAITDHFYKLFDMSNFIDEIVSQKRFMIVLNQVDSYPDKNKKWSEIKAEFRQQLSEQVPVLRSYIKTIPIFLMSAISIDNRKFDVPEDIRKDSLDELHKLRDSIKCASKKLKSIAKSPQYYLQQLFDLLGWLESLIEMAQVEMQDIDENVPTFTVLVDNLSSRQTNLENERQGKLNGFQSSLEERVLSKLGTIDYAKYYAEYGAEQSPPLGNSRELFRWMTNASETIAKNICQDELLPYLQDIIRFAYSTTKDAYQAYVELQDRETLNLRERQSSGIKGEYTVKPFYMTLNHYSGRFLESGRLVNQVFANLFNRFVNWYLLNRGNRNAQGSIELIKKEVIQNVKDATEIFMCVYIYEEPDLVKAYKTQVVDAGEATLWNLLEKHVTDLEDMLATEVRIVNKRIGLYINRKFFVSNKEQYRAIVDELLKLKERTEGIIVDSV